MRSTTWSIVLTILVMPGVVLAATTIGTNISTTGTLSVSGTASMSSDFEVAGYASASKTFGSGLVDCDATASKLLWSITSGRFSCGTDAIGVREAGGSFTNRSSISFEAAHFTLSFPTEALVKLDWDAGGPASLSQNETVSGLWSFTGGASISSNMELTGIARLGINAGTSTDASLEVGGTASVSALVMGTATTASNCSSSASPAVCGSASAGSVVVAATATTVVVNTSAVTANSQVFLTFDSSLGSRLGVTCDTTIPVYSVSARTAGTSFTISVTVAPLVNPACFGYFIVN